MLKNIHAYISKRRKPFAIAASLSLVCLGLVLGIALYAESSSTAWASSLTTAERNDAYAKLNKNVGNLIDGSQRLANITKLATPSVVHIQSERPSKHGGTLEETGSGVIVKSDRKTGYYVVSNRHVIQGATIANISLSLHDGRSLHPKRVWTDAKTDIAVMQIEAEKLQAARWGNSDDLDIGHMVLAMGSPFGLSQSVTFGIISAKQRRSLNLGGQNSVLNQDFLQTDAAINPGNSGGPLIDLSGRIVGINTAIASNSGGNEGIGFSIPSNLAHHVFEQLLEHGTVPRAFLGVMLDDNFSPALAKRLKLDRARGTRVKRVYINTPAARADLRKDDVILSFNGTEIQDESHLINLVSLTDVGKQARLTVLRNGERIQVNVLLSDRKTHETHAARQLRSKRKHVVSPMGMTLHRLDNELAVQVGLPQQTAGLLVLDVPKLSPLASDIQLYDVIEEVARQPVHSPEDWLQAIEQHQDDDQLVLKVRRNQNGSSVTRLVVWKR